MSEKEALSEWQALSQEVMMGMKQWRSQHPKASLGEIEKELDQRLSGLRAQMLQDMALQSSARDWQQGQELEPPVCPECGQVLEAQSQHTRELQTQGQQKIVLQRKYGVCPKCGLGFFPPG